MSYERMGEQEQRLRAEIESLLQRAEEADQSEDHPRANERPHVLAGLARRPKRSRSNVMTTSHRIKEVRGFRRFLLRGMRKVAGEWSMLTATHNLLKLFRNASQAAPA